MKFISRLFLTSHDEAFHWISHWLELSYEGRFQRTRAYGDVKFQENGHKWTRTLADGSWHWCWFEGYPLFIRRKIDERASDGRQVFENLDIWIVGLTSHKAVNKLLDNAMSLRNMDSGRVKIYAYNGAYFQQLAQKPPRKLSSVIMPQDTQDTLVKDVNWFINSQKWYEDRGIPYHRGYLFTGPPGTGKTSLIMAMAYHINRPIYFLNLGSCRSDKDLQGAFFDVDPKSILVLEDIDVAANKRPEPHALEKEKPTRSFGVALHNDQSKNVEAQEDTEEEIGITLSGLLNCLDGILTPEGLMVIMTTNYPENLDSALRRPGRADRIIEFSLLTPPQIQQLFDLIFPNVGLLVDTKKSKSAAEVQGICMEHLDAPLQAIHQLNQ